MQLGTEHTALGFHSTLRCWKNFQVTSRLYPGGSTNMSERWCQPVTWVITHNVSSSNPPGLIVPICKMGLFNPKHREEGTGRAGVSGHHQTGRYFPRLDEL